MNISTPPSVSPAANRLCIGSTILFCMSANMALPLTACSSGRCRSSGTAGGSANTTARTRFRSEPSLHRLNHPLLYVGEHGVALDGLLIWKVSEQRDRRWLGQHDCTDKVPI